MKLPICSSERYMFVTLTSSVHIQEQINNSVSSMGFGKAGHWFRLTLVSLFIFLTAVTTVTITKQLPSAGNATTGSMSVGK